MAHRIRLLLIALTLSGISCGDSTTGTEEDVVDFSGTWTLRVDFSYPPEDVFCTISGISLTVNQDAAALSGSSTGGTQSCSQTGTGWDDIDFGGTTLSGNARPNSVILNLESAIASFSMSGVPRSGRFDGTFQGNAVLEPFDIGDVTVAGSWSASR